jgi:hypothetical protein
MINNIIFTEFSLANGDVIKIAKEEIVKMFISNIDNNGDEIEYENTIIKGKMFANFFMCSIFDAQLYQTLINNSVDSIKLIFKNNKYIEFYLPSTNDPFNDDKRNGFQKCYLNDNVFNLIITNKNIKYCQNLFA